MTADIQKVLTDSDIASIQMDTRVLLRDPSAAFRFARAIERAVLAASDERKDADYYKQRFEAALEFMEKMMRFFRPITRRELWARIEEFGTEYNAKLEAIDAAIAAGKAVEVKS